MANPREAWLALTILVAILAVMAILWQFGGQMWTYDAFA